MQTTIGKNIGGYTILREIGRGGMSTVYAAREERTGQTVALKILSLPPGLSPAQQQDLVARFGREARAVAGLSHPGIVAIHEVGEQEGTHFLAMEYLNGQTLRQRLAQGPLTPAQALPILSQIAGALDAVHAQAVVHRDVKPSNVMLLPDGTAKLLDFGIARQSDDTTITRTGAIVGSPAYMAPEQVRGAPGTASSDIWALGILLYEMLAGGPPFAGPGIASVLYQVTHENPPPVIGLTSKVQRVLRRALEKNPQRRYPTARALADALSAAQPSSRAERTAIFTPALPLPRRVPWRWAALLLPVLLGSGLAARLHHRAPPPRPPVVEKSVPFPTPPNASPRHKTQRPHAAAPHVRAHKAAQAKVHRIRAQAASKHHTHAPVRKTARRRYRHRAHIRRRPTSYRRNNGFDRGASERLQKFIYSPGY